MAWSPTTDGLLSLASSLPLILLGLALLWVRPRRIENTHFALFAVAWGLQVGIVSLSRLTLDPGLYLGFYWASLLLGLGAAYFLAQFASLHPNRNWLGQTSAAPWITLALVIPGLAAFLLQPSLILEEIRLVGDRLQPRFGDWAFLVVAPFYGAFYYALITQFRAARSALGGVAAQRGRSVFLALSLFLGYVTARQFALWVLHGPLRTSQRSLVAIENAALFGLGFLLVLFLLLRLLTRPNPGGRDAPMALSLTLPALIGGTEGALEANGIDFETLGLWRIGAVAYVVYAAARFQLFDLEVRLRRSAVAGIPAALMGISLLVFASVGLGGNPGWPLAIVAVVAILLNVAAWQLREPLADALVPRQAGDPEYLYHRKLEVYRAALEAALAESPASRADQPPLKDLRRQLGIGEREHDVLEFTVRRGLGSRGLPSTATPRVEPGAHILGRYRIDRLLGEGAHGRAYLANDDQGDRPVVIKGVGTGVLGGRAARLLMREARIAGSLRHPNIVRVFDVAEKAGEALIIMEYADGGNLHGLLQRRMRLSLDESTRLLDQVLAGLGAAHAKGVVHRDLKPENILLMRDGTAKLADFGVAREARPDATVGVTQAGAMGTLVYMSPEQVRGRDVDPRSDLYAAAVVFHQCLTGRFYLKVAGRDDFQVRRLILHGAPQLGLKDQPKWVADFLEKGLSKAADRRFQTAGEMRAALRPATPLIRG